MVPKIEKKSDPGALKYCRIANESGSWKLIKNHMPFSSEEIENLQQLVDTA